MDNLRNLFGQVSAMTSMKPSTTSPSTTGGSAGGGSRAGSVGGGAGGGAMRSHKTADRDSYYYIIYRLVVGTEMR
uniref:Uncharacterized protein n=1 Tax=Anopheles dirus TaxID=7168 RepID=A0A182NAJ1_9DIPT